jgi:hypothetical protein
VDEFDIRDRINPDDCEIGGKTEDDEGCVDDETTPQACLNEWAAEYEIDPPRPCYIDTFRHDFESDYKYVLYSGGCDYYNPNRSVNVWWDETQSDWDQVMISSGDLTNRNGSDTLVKGKIRKMWNLKTNAKDRIGFRIPASWPDFKYTGIGVGP